MSIYSTSTTPLSNILDSMFGSCAPSVSMSFSLGSPREKGLYADGATIKDVIFNSELQELSAKD